MTMSAFGIEHGYEVSKAGSSADNERAEHYRRMRNTTGAIGGTAGALGAGTGTVALMEHKGRDPMGFTMKQTPYARSMSAGVKGRILRANVKAHTRQTKVAAGLAAAGLGLSGAYQHARKKELAKRDAYDAGRQRRFITNMAMGGAGGAAAGNIGAKVATRGRSRLRPGRAALAGGALMGGVGVGIVSRERHRGNIHKAFQPETKQKGQSGAGRVATAGLGTAATGAGGYNAFFLGEHARAHGEHAYYSHKLLKEHATGDPKLKLTPKQVSHYKGARALSGRVAGIKGAGAAASLGVAGLGAKAVYESARGPRKKA